MLQHPVLLKALDEIERDATEAMINALDPAEREAKWYTTRAIKELKKQLLKTANAGAVAKDTKVKRARNVQK
ncbi:hypothetical protein BG58_10965 [Caballeronia jiangsuensis]|nr:hypothetical protein BG58_10965 [Caballeronia jiangsuensis]